MDAQAMLDFCKIKSIDGREKHLKVLRIVKKTDVVSDIQGCAEMLG
jgi:hypothetical protein